MKRRITKIILSVLGVLAIVFVAIAAAIILKPIHAVQAPAYEPKIIQPATPAAIEWPVSGNAAIGIGEYGVELAKNPAETSKPIASIAKLMVALTVIKQKPLALDEQGPLITINSDDIGFYYQQLAQDGSVVPVNYGEQISEYQALQALLLPSANNFAETLVRWTFGSQEAYQTYAANLAKDLGLNSSVFLDPSGFMSNTVSITTDLVKLGQTVLKEPVLAQIVGQTKATIPVAGEIKSTNKLLGQEGIIGIKTGNTNEAGGCYLFAATQNVQNQPITMTGAVLGATDLKTAMAESLDIIKNTFNNFNVETPVINHQTIATYTSQWGTTASVSAKQDLTIVRWPSDEVKQEVTLKPINADITQGTEVGTLKITYGTKTQNIPLVLNSQMPKPSYWWRFLHLLK